MREALLKQEYAALYPGLHAGVWYPAAHVAEYFLTQFTQLPDASGDMRDRILDERHFEFRGGPAAPQPDEPRRTR